MGQPHGPHRRENFGPGERLIDTQNGALFGHRNPSNHFIEQHTEQIPIRHRGHRAPNMGTRLLAMG